MKFASTSRPVSQTRRVVITGIGIVTPGGVQREACWQSLLRGERHIRWLDETHLPLTGSAAMEPERWFGGAVPIAREHNTEVNRLQMFARMTAEQAVEQAGLSREQLNHACVVVGTSKPDLNAIDTAWLTDQGPLQHVWASQPASDIATNFGCQGAAICPVAACATGLVSMIHAANLIRHGNSDVVLAGSVDSSLHPGLLSSYRRLGVLAKVDGDPGLSCRPFDMNRTGFSVGEGGAVMVLESEEHARARNAEPLAEFVDGIVAADPSGITNVDSSGNTLAELAQRLLRRQCLTAADVQFVSLHGTATQMNDQAEANAIELLFRDEGNSVAGFGVKGGIGHLMGAAGAVETAFTALALRDQLLPPTVNHESPDIGPHLHLLQHQQSAHLQYALKMSLGFGGHIAMGLLKTPS